MTHKMATPKKPVINALNDFCLIATPTVKEVMAKLYQGKVVNKPTAKANRAVSMIDTINFIFIF